MQRRAISAGASRRQVFALCAIEAVVDGSAANLDAEGAPPHDMNANFGAGDVFLHEHGRSALAQAFGEGLIDAAHMAAKARASLVDHAIGNAARELGDAFQLVRRHPARNGKASTGKALHLKGLRAIASAGVRTVAYRKRGGVEQPVQTVAALHRENVQLGVVERDAVRQLGLEIEPHDRSLDVTEIVPADGRIDVTPPVALEPERPRCTKRVLGQHEHVEDAEEQIAGGHCAAREGECRSPFN